MSCWSKTNLREWGVCFLFLELQYFHCLHDVNQTVPKGQGCLRQKIFLDQNHILLAWYQNCDVACSNEALSQIKYVINIMDNIFQAN